MTAAVLTETEIRYKYKTKASLNQTVRTKKTVIVNVVIVNSIMWAEGWERGERGKSQGRGIVTREETRVDGNSTLRARSWPSK
jgi:hypothetical protein